MVKARFNNCSPGQKATMMFLRGGVVRLGPTMALAGEKTSPPGCGGAVLFRRSRIGNLAGCGRVRLLHVANRGCWTAEEDRPSIIEGTSCGCGFSSGRPKLWYSNPSSVMVAGSRRLRPSTMRGRLIAP